VLLEQTITLLLHVQELPVVARLVLPLVQLENISQLPALKPPTECAPLVPAPIVLLEQTITLLLHAQELPVVARLVLPLVQMNNMNLLPAL